MKTFLLVILVGFSLNSYAQFEIGSKWTYTARDFGILKPTTIEIKKDTLINNQRWNILEGIGGCANSFSNSAIRQSDSKVHLLDFESNEEILLYDFDLKEGESYDIPIFGTNIVYEVNIDSVGLINIEGDEFRVQYIDQIDFGNYIIEGIGSNHYLVPQGNICDPQFFGIRCFSSDIQDLDFDLEHECDVTFFPTAINEINPTGKIEVYPNPTSNNYITVINNSGTPVTRIKVINFRGQVLLNYKPMNGFRNQISIEDLNAGMYFIAIHLNNRLIFKKQLIR